MWEGQRGVHRQKALDLIAEVAPSSPVCLWVQNIGSENEGCSGPSLRGFKAVSFTCSSNKVIGFVGMRCAVPTLLKLAYWAETELKIYRIPDIAHKRVHEFNIMVRLFAVCPVCSPCSACV